MTSAPTIAIGPDSHNNDRNTLANKDSKTPLFQTLFQLTGNRCLDGELIENTDDGSDYHVEIIYNANRERVPLTFSEADRHLTILTINRVMNPDYEIRFCIDSDGGDTLGFVALSSNEWIELQKQYGDLVDKHFYRIAETPNLFTDPLTFT